MLENKFCLLKKITFGAVRFKCYQKSRDILIVFLVLLTRRGKRGKITVRLISRSAATAKFKVLYKNEKNLLC